MTLHVSYDRLAVNTNLPAQEDRNVAEAAFEGKNTRFKNRELMKRTEGSLYKRL